MSRVNTRNTYLEMHRVSQNGISSSGHDVVFFDRKRPYTTACFYQIKLLFKFSFCILMYFIFDSLMKIEKFSIKCVDLQSAG